MNERIVYRNPDGTVSVVTPAIGVPLDFIRERDIPTGVESHIVDRTGIPQDRTFRGAWELTANGEIIHNMGKAKEIQKDRWRKTREQLLKQADTEYLQALEKGNPAEIKKVVDKKQSLRDVTKTDLSGVNTIEDLKKIWPDVLGK